MSSNHSGPTSLELFAGGGGMALGMHEAGFRHRRLLEWEGKACDTLRANAGPTRKAPWAASSVVEADVREALIDGTLDGIGDVDLLAGGPPCQPFSLGGGHRADGDERNMFPAAIAYMREFRPKIAVWENVFGLARPSFRPYFDYILDAMRWPTSPPAAGEPWTEHHRRIQARKAGPLDTRYRVGWQILDSADFGVPQRRRRVFFAAIRADLLDDAPTFPEPTHSGASLKHAQWVTHDYWHEHGVEPPPARPDGMTEEDVLTLKLNYDGKERWRTVRDALRGNPDRGQEPLPEPVDGREHPEVLNHVGIPGARSYPGHTGSPIDLPAKTVKAGVHGVCGGEAMTRYWDGALRYWTIRESARIQGFPDDYEFKGARSHAMRHIGNAVSVDVARIVGEHVRGLAGI